MANIEIAERIKDAIKQAGGYEAISRTTGLNTRTLTRIASGDTDPKLSNFIAISEATQTSAYYLIYGDEQVEQIGSAFASMPDMMVKAFLSQQQQTEKVINERLSNIEKLISHIGLDGLENIQSEINKVADNFREESQKDTDALVAFGEGMKDMFSDIEKAAQSSKK